MRKALIVLLGTAACLTWMYIFMSFIQFVTQKQQNMQPYGKIIEIRNSCVCCGTSKCSRADAKIEVRKIIEEESYQRNICAVCNGEDDPRCVECC